MTDPLDKTIQSKMIKHESLSELQVQALIEVVRYIESHADEKLTLANLAERVSFSPTRLQKVFKLAFGVSPKMYQEALRMQRLKSELKQGDSITDAIYNAGFGSISRVYGEPTRQIGMPLKSYRAGGQGEEIHYACRQTLLGLMMMAATNKGVCFVQFDDDAELLYTYLAKEFPKATLIPSSAQSAPTLDIWVAALDEHISHNAPRPDIPLDIRGTAFQIQIWKFLLSVKEGETLSYSELAIRTNQPKAVRAVASACARNKIGILIPCHRVLRSDGSLGGYRWGLERKQQLLAKETN